MNILALAAAWPDAHFTGFDLAETVIARGRGWAEAAGLANVDLRVGDIMDAHLHYPARSFDYVIAHGVYAWVPEAVQRATMALTGHLLSDNGVALISYNAMPGGYIRHMMRDMTLYAIADVHDPAERIVATREYLQFIADQPVGDDRVKGALQAQAQSMLSRPNSVLFHDELGDEFRPQYLRDVAAAAAEQGLRFLSDAGRNRHLDGFLKDNLLDSPDPEAMIVRQNQFDDFDATRFFRSTLLVRQEQMPRRRVDLNTMDGLWVSSRCKRNEEGDFVLDTTRFEINDPELAAVMEKLIAIYPERLPLDGMALDEGGRAALLRLFAQWAVNLHMGPLHFSLELAERPETSRLVRAQIADGDMLVCTLDHDMIRIDQPEMRHLLAHADGTRTVADLAALPDAGFPADQIGPALTAAARRGLLY